jgi:hypothetical protein
MTRGGLRPATISNVNNTAEIVRFMFNPHEFSINKTITWSPEGGAGQNIPQYVYDRTSAPTISLTLHFDSQDLKKDVRDFTYLLWKFTMVDESRINQTTGKGEPPPVAFEWGRLYFKAVITRLSEKFTLFDIQGTPLRCEIGIDLTLYEGLQTYQKQGTGALRQATGNETPRITLMAQGQRLDQIAAQNGGQSSNYRNVAASNNIDNPQRVPPGTKLNT